MIRVKFCGLRYPEDVTAVNLLRPDWIGFVFAPGSRRFLPPGEAARLRALLDPAIPAVGVFVSEAPETVAELLNRGIIDLAQLHGQEDEAWLSALRRLTDRPVIQAFRVRSAADLARAQKSRAEQILLDAGAGEGRTFDWTLLRGFSRPYFLAGGLTPENVGLAVRTLRPFALDVSSGIETDGRKDPARMRAFLQAVREAEG